MPLPDFNDAGDLPEGVHRAKIAEVRQRLGTTTNQRQRVFQQLYRIYRLALATNQLERFIIFGSFVTIKANPNDVDILLVMRDDFELAACSGELRKVFYHDEAAVEFKASIFWIRPSMLVLDTLEDFISH